MWIHANCDKCGKVGHREYMDYTHPLRERDKANNEAECDFPRKWYHRECLDRIMEDRERYGLARCPCGQGFIHKKKRK